MRRAAILGATALVLLAGACTRSDRQTPAPIPSPSSGAIGGAGIANPASEYCVSQGGTVEIETDANGGEVGYCNLPDGRRIEEWEFYRSENPDIFGTPSESASS